MTQDVEDQHVTIKEAARLTGRTVRTIQRWIDEGHVDANTGYNNRGQAIRFVSRMALEKWAEGRDDEATTHDVSPGVTREDSSAVRNDDARVMIERYLATMQTQAEALRDAQERFDHAMHEVADSRERAAIAETRSESLTSRLADLEAGLAQEREEAARRVSIAQAEMIRAEAELTETRRTALQHTASGRAWWKFW